MSITHGSVGSSNLRGRVGKFLSILDHAVQNLIKLLQKTTGQKETEKYRIFLKLMHYFT